MSRAIGFFLVAAGVTAWLAAAPVMAQHESEGAVSEGRAVYVSLCANCHGPDGDQIGGINFARGQYRRSYSDTELKDIVRNGIKGTPMPGTNVSDSQATRIVGYLRYLGSSPPSNVSGDASRGAALFQGKGACGTCHAMNGQGSPVGPDLSSIGSVRRATELQQSILEPGKEVLPQNRSYRVVTRDGKTVTGRLLNQDTFSVQLLDSNGQLRSFDRAALREHAFIDSPMPSYRGKLSDQELADVITYLSQLKRR